MITFVNGPRRTGTCLSWGYFPPWLMDVETTRCAGKPLRPFGPSASQIRWDMLHPSTSSKRKMMFREWRCLMLYVYADLSLVKTYSSTAGWWHHKSLNDIPITRCVVIVYLLAMNDDGSDSMRHFTHSPPAHYCVYDAVRRSWWNKNLIVDL